MIEIPPQIEEIARILHADGCRFAEAVPIERWRARRWPEDDRTFALVDACLRLLRAIEKK